MLKLMLNWKTHQLNLSFRFDAKPVHAGALPAINGDENLILFSKVHFLFQDHEIPHWTWPRTGSPFQTGWEKHLKNHVWVNFREREGTFKIAKSSLSCSDTHSSQWSNPGHTKTWVINTALEWRSLLYQRYPCLTHCPAEPHLQLHLLPNILLSRQMGGWLSTDVCIFLKQSHITKENV